MKFTPLRVEYARESVLLYIPVELKLTCRLWGPPLFGPGVVPKEFPIENTPLAEKPSYIRTDLRMPDCLGMLAGMFKMPKPSLPIASGQPFV